MKSFQDSIEQMLWPEKRDKDSVFGDKVPGVIDRTTDTSYLRIPAGYVPGYLHPLLGLGSRLFPSLLGDGGVQIGPIPAGTPVDLLANLNLLPDSNDPVERLKHDGEVLDLLLKAQHDLAHLPKGATDEGARRVFANLADPLFELSKCPDYVVNRGHYFGTDHFKQEPGLSDYDKRALIEFLKTF
jgi:hypothetical protein